MEEQYKLVSSVELDTLEVKVNNCLEAGFVPHGPLIFASGEFVQAMTYGIVPVVNVSAQVQNNY